MYTQESRCLNPSCKKHVEISNFCDLHFKFYSKNKISIVFNEEFEECFYSSKKRLMNKKF